MKHCRRVYLSIKRERILLACYGRAHICNIKCVLTGLIRLPGMVSLWNGYSELWMRAKIRLSNWSVTIKEFAPSGDVYRLRQKPRQRNLGDVKRASRWNAIALFFILFSIVPPSPYHHYFDLLLSLLHRVFLSLLFLF